MTELILLIVLCLSLLICLSVMAYLCIQRQKSYKEYIKEHYQDDRKLPEVSTNTLMPNVSGGYQPTPPKAPTPPEVRVTGRPPRKP